MANRDPSQTVSHGPVGNSTWVWAGSGEQGEFLFSGNVHSLLGELELSAAADDRARNCCALKSGDMIKLPRTAEPWLVSAEVAEKPQQQLECEASSSCPDIPFLTCHTRRIWLLRVSGVVAATTLETGLDPLEPRSLLHGLPCWPASIDRQGSSRLLPRISASPPCCDTHLNLPPRNGWEGIGLAMQPLLEGCMSSAHAASQTGYIPHHRADPWAGSFFS